MKDCERFADMLPSYIEGTLNVQQIEAVENHLSSCYSCSQKLESLRRVENVAAEMRTAVPSDDDATRLSEAVIARMKEAVPVEQTRRSRYRSAFFRRLAPTLAAAAVLLVVMLAWPAFHGTSGLTWAAVLKSVEGRWFHEVTKDSSTGHVLYESWWSPGSLRSYMKTHESRPSLQRVDAAYTDHIAGESWWYDAGANTITILPSQKLAGPMPDYYATLLNPGANHGFEKTVTRGKSADGLTPFDVSYGGPAMNGRTSTCRTWVDDKTALPVRMERQDTRIVDGKETTQSTISEVDYPATGPANIYALGVPHDAKIVDTRPSPDFQKLLEICGRYREAFPKEYKAIVVGGEDTFCYVVSHKGGTRYPMTLFEQRSGPPPHNKDYQVRLDMYFSDQISALDDPAASLMSRSLSPCSVGIRSGPWTGEWSIDRPFTKSYNEFGGAPVNTSEADPGEFAWMLPGGGPAVFLKSTDPALAGCVGVEITNSVFGKANRTRYWLNTQRDYIIQLCESEQLENGRWVAWRREEVTAYAQLSTGQWYPKARRVYGPKFDWEYDITVQEHPVFDKDTFDMNVCPWATALITVTDPQGKPVPNAKLMSLTLGDDIRYENKDSAMLVKNLPRNAPVDALIFDESRRLAKAVTITPDGDETKLAVTLESGLSVEGAVKTESGTPVAGASMLLCARRKGAGRVPYIFGGITDTDTDAQGHYKFNMVVPGVQFGVSMYHNAYTGDIPTVMVDTTANTASVPDITALPRAQIGGRVTDAATGQPLEGINVHIRFNWDASFAKSGLWNTGSGNRWDVKSDKDGKWSFDVNPRRVLIALVEDPRYHAAWYDKVEPGAMNVDFPLVPIPGPIRESK